MMLELQQLWPNQYRQVAEWEHGEQPDNTDWDRYAAEMNGPTWLHFGIYSGHHFVGALSLEKISVETMDYHVVTARHSVHPNSLARLLLSTAGHLFNEGYKLLRVRIPADNRAAARLALRCGMVELASTPEERYFMLTESRFHNGF